MIDKVKGKNLDMELTLEFDDLLRRIDDTRRSRFHMAKRLKSEHEARNKLLLFYNIVIIVLSIITMYQYFMDGVPIASHIILAFSISLSLYSTYTSGVNRLTTAGIMTQNGHALSVIHTELKLLTHKVLPRELHMKNLKEISQRYEYTIDNVQNHADIDYYSVKNGTTRDRTPQRKIYIIEKQINYIEEKEEVTQENTIKEISRYDFQEKINRYEKNERMKIIGGYIMGIIIFSVLLLYPVISPYFYLN